MAKKNATYNVSVEAFDVELLNFFLVNHITFPEFSQVLSRQLWIFNSTLVINYPNQASFERNWVFLIVFSFLHAYWIVSDGPSGHLKQSIQKTFFEQRSTSTCWRALKGKKLFRNCHNIVLTSFLYFWTVFFRRCLQSDQYRKTYRKTIKYETILDHARRP